MPSSDSIAFKSIVRRGRRATEVEMLEIVSEKRAASIFLSFHDLTSSDCGTERERERERERKREREREREREKEIEGDEIGAHDREGEGGRGKSKLG